MSRTGYIAAMIALVAAFVAFTLVWQDQFFENWLLNAASLAVLIGGAGSLTMVRKRARQAATRSRALDSIERRASEQASETSFEVSLVLIAVLAACLSFAWGGLGFILGGAALLASVGAHWMAYGWRLRRATADAQ